MFVTVLRSELYLHPRGKNSVLRILDLTSGQRLVLFNNFLNIKVQKYSYLLPSQPEIQPFKHSCGN